MKRIAGIIIFLLLFCVYAPASSRSAGIVNPEEIGNTVPLPVLLDLLKNENSKVRERAAEILGENGDASAITALVDALKDGSAAVRRSAVEALTRLSDSSITPVLAKMLKDPDKEIRGLTAEILGEIGGPAAVPALAEALKDKVAANRERAITSLGKIGDTAAITVLSGVLRKDREVALRVSAAYVLGNMGEAAVPALLKALSARSTKMYAAIALGKALEKTKDTAVIPALIKALDDRSIDIRKYIVISLAKLGKPAVIALADNLGDRSKNEEERKYSAEALGTIGDTSAVPALLEAMDDASGEIRNYAAGSLSRMGKSAIEQAGRKMVEREGSFDARLKNAFFLAKFGEEKTLQFLTKLLNYDAYRPRAAQALEQYYGGKVKKESSSREITCPVCGGAKACPGCGGSGKTVSAMLMPFTCGWCGGSGICPTCAGKGRITRLYYKYVYFPPGKITIGMPEIEPGD